MTTRKVRHGIVTAAVALFAMFGSGQVFAVDDYLTANDSAEVSSFNSAANWQSGSAPGPGTNYFTSGFVISTLKSAGEITFQGDSLTLNRRFYQINLSTTTIPNLIVQDGGYIYTAGSKGPIDGKITISPNVTFAWTDGYAGGDSSQTLSADIVGEESAILAFSATSVSGGASKAVKKYWTVDGNLSAFNGKIYADHSNVTVTVCFSGDQTSFPGTLQFKNAAKLKINVAQGVSATIGSLDATDVEVALGDGATLTVSGDVSLYGNKIRLASDHAYTAAAESIPLLTFSTAVLSTDDVSLEALAAAAETGLAHCPEAIPVQTAVSDGTFTVSHRRIVYQTTDDTKGTTSIFTSPDEARWSEQLDAETAAETDYYLSQATAYHPLTSPVTFYGKSLTLAGNSGYSGVLETTGKRTLTIADFRWLADGKNATQISSYNGAITFNGNITVLPSADDVYFGIKQWNSNVMTFNSDIKGAGNIRFTCHEAAMNDASATYELTGNNCDFTGRMLVMHAPFTGKTPKANPDDCWVTVKVSAERNLGGVLPAFDAASLSIEDNSLLYVTETATFSEPTRGWRVRGHGRIHVEADKVATVDKTLTYADDGTDAGRLTKEGAGTLALGGRAVLDGDLDKMLEVKTGALRFASTGAVDNVSVSFAADTKLEVDLSAMGDVANWGAVNASATPFTSAAESGKIPLSLLAPDKIPDLGLSVAICTVSDTLKDALKFDCPTRCNHRKTSVDYVDNGDGTVTFFVRVESKKGLIVIFK